MDTWRGLADHRGNAPIAWGAGNLARAGTQQGHEGGRSGQVRASTGTGSISIRLPGPGPVPVTAASGTGTASVTVPQATSSAHVISAHTGAGSVVMAGCPGAS